MDVSNQLPLTMEEAVRKMSRELCSCGYDPCELDDEEWGELRDWERQGHDIWDNPYGVKNPDGSPCNFIEFRRKLNFDEYCGSYSENVLHRYLDLQTLPVTEEMHTALMEWVSDCKSVYDSEEVDEGDEYRRPLDFLTAFRKHALYNAYASGAPKEVVARLEMEYFISSTSVTPEEQQALEERIAEGGSIFDCDGLFYDENGDEMDYLSAFRTQKDILQTAAENHRKIMMELEMYLNVHSMTPDDRKELQLMAEERGISPFNNPWDLRTPGGYTVEYLTAKRLVECLGEYGASSLLCGEGVCELPKELW